MLSIRDDGTANLTTDGIDVGFQFLVLRVRPSCADSPQGLFFATLQFRVSLLCKEATPRNLRAWSCRTSNLLLKKPLDELPVGMVRQVLECELTAAHSPIPERPLPVRASPLWTQGSSGCHGSPRSHEPSDSSTHGCTDTFRGGRCHLLAGVPNHTRQRPSTGQSAK